MESLRASNLNQLLLVTGGREEKKSNWVSGKKRDEVLQYNVESRRWTQIGTIEEARDEHAVAEANLGALCRPFGRDGVAAKSVQEDLEVEVEEKVEKLIVEHFEEQKRFIAEQFEDQKRFIAEQFGKYIG